MDPVYWTCLNGPTHKPRFDIRRKKPCHTKSCKEFHPKIVWFQARRWVQRLFAVLTCCEHWTLTPIMNIKRWQSEIGVLRNIRQRYCSPTISIFWFAVCFVSFVFWWLRTLSLRDANFSNKLAHNFIDMFPHPCPDIHTKWTHVKTMDLTTNVLHQRNPILSATKFTPEIAQTFLKFLHSERWIRMFWPTSRRASCYGHLLFPAEQSANQLVLPTTCTIKKPAPCSKKLVAYVTCNDMCTNKAVKVASSNMLVFTIYNQKKHEMIAAHQGLKRIPWLMDWYCASAAPHRRILPRRRPGRMPPILLATATGTSGGATRAWNESWNESDHDSSNTLALYNGLKLTRPNEGYQWLSGCFCVDPLLLTSSSRVELPRGRHWSLETWKCRGELCTLHKNFSYPCKVRLRNQRLASWKLWNYLSLSSRRRAYPKRTLRITLRSSSSALDSSFLIWRTSSRAPASRFSSRAAISRNFFSSFRASNSSTSLKDWDLGSSNKSFSGCAASFRLRPPLSLFSPLIFTSSFGPATFAALEIAEVAAVLRELVEIVLLESSRAATSFARAFGHDFATWPTSLQ